MATITYKSVGKRYLDGTVAVNDLNLKIADGEFLVVVGPSGCGKTTALRMAAGLEDISSGELLIDDKVVNDLEPRDRDIAMVFQNYALYPHMTIFENIAFPLENQKLSNEEIKKRVHAAAETLSLTEHLGRRPKNLSGGQRQRVAMGRAIVRRPKAFLMDEPLSNLDAKLRVQMRAEITSLQRSLGVSTLYVTHDQVEAMTMGDRIAVMRKGVLQQVGTPLELYSNPVNLFVAAFVGSPAMNLLGAVLHSDGGKVVLRIGTQQVPLPADLVLRHGLGSQAGRRITVGVRPEDLLVPSQGDPSLPRLQAEVTLIERLPPEQLAHLRIDADVVTDATALEVAADVDTSAADQIRAAAGRGRAAMVARLPGSVPLQVGASEWSIDPSKLFFFDGASGQSLLR
ncbi:sn-glycerol-3-phosphate ABC transporter ATP-binding protein UgpC [Rhizobium sp. RU36D]|uniref:ABC transporter ATP-binding protein n=1 Tax=Rhizobium sp. RU36D TaxID=1907415 RepID=UPI0009D8CB84|nr:sn-glycerol-3-phosphate ABC transporter ATP-binding protein UgpC [Rhizobium sp. RU36D]SMD20101.1 carbohydrate ABC transporter ATP-binding protein, CUT1 family [Rhizobium sp. RU36D]